MRAPSTALVGLVTALVATAITLPLGPASVAVADTNEAPPGLASVIQGRIAAGGYHTCALVGTGSVQCWGMNREGQLGVATNVGNQNPNPTPQAAVNLGRPATSITAGSVHNCALLDNGTIRCWGENFDGQLGAPANNQPNPTPQAAVNLGRAATLVIAGDYFTCALLDNGAVRCWGYNSDGQLGAPANGDPNPTPQPAVNLGRPATAISTGADHACALLDNGTVRCWGYNGSGQLGAPASGDPNPTPQPAVNLGAGRRAVAISAGYNHTCALLDDGNVRCWGSNRYGQLGGLTNSGNNNANPTPFAAVGLGHRATAISSSNAFVCARLENGTARCWGFNEYGHLGSPTNNNTTLPNPTPEPAISFGAGRTVAAVTVGGDHGCAVLDNGTVRCWGWNGFGQLGSPINNGFVTPNPTPLGAVPGITVSLDDSRPVFTSVAPSRFADSRNEPTFDGLFRNTGLRAAKSVWEIKIAGRGTVPINASAAVVNLTINGANSNGFATAYPCGPVPGASSINYTPGVTSANEVATKLSATGTICVYTHTAAHVIVDVAGHATESAYQPLAPRRFADSRNEPTFDNKFRNTGPRAAGTVWQIDIAGRGGIPTTTKAAVVNLTITGAAKNGFAVAYDCGTRPGASSINYRPDVTRANEVITKLSAAGKLCVYTHTQANVVVDVVGVIDTTAARYVASTPRRFADSRNEPTFDGGFRNTGPRAAGTVWEIQVRGRGGIPANAQAAVVNLTITGADRNGFATIYPCGPRPNASSINYTPGVTVANETVTKLSPTGTICIYTHTRTHVITDIVGHTT